MPRRLAFTLIELLVVIAIIATLAGLLIPTTSIIQSKMKDVKCSNQLRQVGIGIIAVRMERDDKLPPSLRSLFLSESGLQMTGLERLLICPRDQSKGTTPTMNRVGPLTPDLHELWDHEQLYPPGTPLGVSYLYQCSGAKIWGGYDLSSSSPTASDPMSWFYCDLSIPDPSPNIPTWGEAKRNELMRGQPTPSGYTAWPGDIFPMVSCFWHQRWTSANAKTDKKTVSIAWNGNIFWHIPFWSAQFNNLVKFSDGTKYQQ